MIRMLLVLVLFSSAVISQEPAAPPVVVSGAEVALDLQAFEFAKREAQAQASRGRVGHLLGIAPGCRFAGVGSSGSIHRPQHCTTGRYRLVARAWAIGANGKVYWSAHYR